MAKDETNSFVDDMVERYEFAMGIYSFCEPLYQLQVKHDFRICCGDMPTKSDVASVIFPADSGDDNRPGCGFTGQDLYGLIFDDDPCVAIIYSINKDNPSDSDVLAVGALIATTYENFGFVVDKPESRNKCVLVYPARKRPSSN
jgi:hypothetical protein